VPLCYVQKWLFYEKFLQTALQVAIESKTKLLFLKTTNYVCQQKYEDPYATTVAAYDRERQIVLNRIESIANVVDSNKSVQLFKQIGNWLRTNSTTESPNLSDPPANTTYLNQSQFGICMDGIQKKMLQATDIVLSEADAARYCYEATFDLTGSQNLNRRVKKFLAENRPLLQNSGLTVALYNDHALQSCEYTDPGDGRHFHTINLVRLRLLANMINAMY